MIVRLDLECDRESIADIDNAGILAGTLQHRRTLRRQPAQMDARTLVAAVFAPHHTENSELRQRRLAFQDRDDLLVFAVGDSVLLKQFFSNHQIFTSALTIDSKISRPSELPRIVSLERSGCGIIPS